jgi:serine/threonine protein kinase
LNDEKSGFLRKYNEMDYSSPLSPQAMKSLMLGPERSNYDKEKNDIWSLGITLLTSFVNEDYNNYYDWPKYTVSDSLIRSRIVKLTTDFNYTSKLVNLISRMLETDEFSRIGIVELTYSAGLSKTQFQPEETYKGSIGGGDF